LAYSFWTGSSRVLSKGGASKNPVLLTGPSGGKPSMAERLSKAAANPGSAKLDGKPRESRTS
jgi:hypothetical protein